MEAVVETYGSNGEIAVAFQLVDHISKRYNIPISSSVWRELLEWTYVMSCPPASTAWGYAGMPSKVSSHSAIEAIWDTMTSAPYHIQPDFEQHGILIRNLLARRHFSKVVPLIHKAVEFYDGQCQEYTEAVLEYVQVARDGLGTSESLRRYEQARYKKAKMHFDIQKWCRQFLAGVRSFSLDNPLTTTMVPDFIHQFQRFIPNPIRYRTSTGYVDMLDPARESVARVSQPDLPIDLPKIEKGTVKYEKRQLKYFVGRTRRSLAGHIPVLKFDLYNLLTGTSRFKWDWESPPDKQDTHMNSKDKSPLSGEETAKTSEEMAQAQNWDDDEDF